MRLWVIICFLGFVLSAQRADARSISTECVSNSGMSRYDLALDLLNDRGFIRYRFQNQDIRYRVIIETKSSDEVWGKAVFDSSRTGEVRGNPFNFVYSRSRNEFRELRITAKCR